MRPKRIQQQLMGWEKPEGAVCVDRRTRWGNPFVGLNGLARVPALDGSPWEYETRISSPRDDHAYRHPNNPDGTPGAITHHQIRDLTRAEQVQVYRQALLTPSRGGGCLLGQYRITPHLVRIGLAGRDLACHCPLDQPCHADVLLEVANAVRLITCAHTACVWCAPVTDGADLAVLEGWTFTTTWWCPRHHQTKEDTSA